MTRVLVKLPFAPEQTVLSFPFLQLLGTQEMDELFVIADQGNSTLLEAFGERLIQKAKVFEIPLNKRGIIGAHHYAMNLNDIFNIDRYIDLESSYGSTSLGVTFKARERIGFERGKVQKIFYHKNIPWLNGVGTDSNYVRLLSEGLGLSERKAYLETISNHEVSPLTKYVFVALRGLFDPGSRDLYANFFAGLDHTSIIFWDLDGELATSFYEQLHPKLHYKIIKSASMKDVENVAKTAVGVLTNQTWMSWLASYWGIRSVCFNAALERSRYFDLSPQAVPLKEDTDEALNFVHNYFSL